MFVGKNTFALIEVGITKTPLVFKYGKTDMVRWKTQRYKNFANELNCKSIPVVISVTGEWMTEEAVMFFDQMLNRVVMRSDSETGAKKREFYSEVAAYLVTSLKLHCIEGL